MLSLADISTQLWFSKVMAMSLPRFYKKTGLSAQFSFIYNPKIESIEINLGFYPKEPTNEEYNILFEEITDAEKLLMNDYILQESSHFENLKQMVFKHKEESQKIISQHKKDL